MIRNLIICATAFLSFLPLLSDAQDASTFLRQAEREEKAFHDPQALAKYKEVLEIERNNLVALYKTSQLYSLIGKRLENKADQRKYFLSARSYAKQALKVNANSSEANLAMALAMGRIALISSGEDKVRAGKDIKTYAEKAIKLDPLNYKAYHILGKWHYEISDMNSVEKFLMKMVYGELPAASLEDAQRYYEKSRQINPGFLLNYLELARVHSKNGHDGKAKILLEKMLSLPTTSSDDARIRLLGREMLADLR